MDRLAMRRSEPATDGHPGFPVLNDFVDGMLSAPLLIGIEAHVERCSVCRAIVAGLRDLIAMARAEGQQLVRAPAALRSLVTAVTIHRRPLLHYFLNGNRGKLVLGALLFMLAGAAAGVWLVLGCAGDRQDGQARQCDAPWYQVVGHGAQQRVKEFRNYAKGNVNAERKRLQHSLPR